MKILAKTATFLLLSCLALCGLSACGSEEKTAGAPQTEIPSVEVSQATSGSAASQETILLDVRTPEEFAAGHVEGAINLDYYSPDFQEEILKLDRNATYEVYCRSGKRAGNAKTMMENSGFSHVTNIGGIEEASASTGKEIVE